MHKHSFFEHFSPFACLIAASAVLIALLASCGGESEEPDPAPKTTASVEKNAVSTAETSSPTGIAAEQPDASATVTVAENTETWEGFVYSPEDRSDGKIVMYAERVYYDGNPEPDTERVVYLHAPANSVNLVIPDGVTELDPEAFHDCANLESVVFPNSVDMIPADAFSVAPTGPRVPCCPKLKSVVLPIHAAIGANAFHSVRSLESVTLNNDGKPAALPREDAAIGYYAFFFCSELKEIAIPEGVEAIGEGAISSCRKLERVFLPASLKTIGRHAFVGCSSLKEITIPNGVTEIGDDAFRASPCAESVLKEMESRNTSVQP